MTVVKQKINIESDIFPQQPSKESGHKNESVPRLLSRLAFQEGKVMPCYLSPALNRYSKGILLNRHSLFLYFSYSFRYIADEF